MRFLSLLYYHTVRRKLPHMKRTNERFRTAKQFDRLYSLERDPFNVEASDYEMMKRDDLIASLQGRKFERILDIGCGTGVTLRSLAKLGRDVVGLDFSERAIEIAHRSLGDLRNVRLMHGDVRNLPEEEKYDLFVCSEVLYYLTEEELAEVLRSIRKLALPNAILASVTRADDARVLAKLRSEFEMISEKTNLDCGRPYSITQYRV